MPDPIEFYFWPTPNGWKVSIALAEFALPHVTRLIDIDAGDQQDDGFRAISPNGRIPAIVDPDGPDGAPVAIFESGAILQYLARKTGRFGGRTARERIEVEQWLMWQMGGLGPIAGQAHHFLKALPNRTPPVEIAYAMDRYRAETARLYGVLDRRLGDRDWVAGDFFSIADMAIWGWASLWEGQQQTLDDKPHLARWLDACLDRPGLRAGRLLHADRRRDRPDRYIRRLRGAAD